MSNFQLYSKYYDLLYKDKNYKEESRYVIETVRQLLPGAIQMLELGSGTGSHAEYFCEAGFEVTGIERSSEMVEVSKSKNISGFRPVTGDISKYKLEQQFDVAISLFHVISYLTQNDSLIDCFRATHKHLNTNGLFIFDIWYSPAVFHQKPETRIRRLENDEIKIVRLAEPETVCNENLVTVNFEVIINDKGSNINESITEKHMMRHFSIPEIRMLATLTGFEVMLAEEFLTKAHPSESTWGVCFILKKI